MQTLNEKGILDYTGATVSWVCAIHCLAMPFLITVLPLIGLNFLENELIEWILIGVSAIVSLLSLLPSYIYRHRKLGGILLFSLGFSLILVSHLVFEDETFFAVPFIVLGTVLITSAHFINRRLCQNCLKFQANSQLVSTKQPLIEIK